MTYFGTRLSPHLSRREPEGYLICTSVPVARTGVQEYLPSELGLDMPDDRMIPVIRPEEEVFSPEAVASFEGMPVTDGHPALPEGVTAENIRVLQKGHAHNVRRGAGKESDLLLADLIITDPELIDRILNGKREISCGYNYILSEEDGKFFQRGIRGNHVAVVDAGRAGHRVSIRDRKNERSETTMKNRNRMIAAALARTVRDGTPEEAAELIGEILEAVTEAPAGGELLPPAEAPMAGYPAGAPVRVTAAGIPMTGYPVGVPAGVPAAGIPATGYPAGAPVGVPAGAGVPLNAAAAGAGGAPLGVTAAGVPWEAEPEERAADCGPEILAALSRIIALLEGPAGTDCGNSCRTADETEEPETGAEIPASAAGTGSPAASALEAAENAARTAGEASEAAEAAALAAEAAAAAAEILDPEGAAEDDPVIELVEAILESGEEAAPAPAEEGLLTGDPGEVLSAVLEPEADEDAEDPEDRAADALRAALSVFRPHLKRMSPAERRRFNADVSARLREAGSRRAPGRSTGLGTAGYSSGAAGRGNGAGMAAGGYAALSRSAGQDRSARSLGQRIMAGRNANYSRQ